MPAMPDPVETHTWGPRPAILNDLSGDEETDGMSTIGEGRAGDGVGADQADVGGGGGGSNKCRVWQDVDAPR